MIKLSTWAKRNNVCYTTAWRWVHAGKFPGRTLVTGTGSIFVIEEPEAAGGTPDNGTAIYCRVSTHERKADLSRQVERCKEFALANGWSVDRIGKEIASGMNDRRPELWKVIDAKPSRIIVEDREDLIKDLCSVIYSFCARLYGMRRAANKARRIREEIKEEE